MPIEPTSGVHGASDDRPKVWKSLVPRMSLDVVLESILVTIVTSYFIYLLLAVRDLRAEAARLPKVTAIGGLVLVAVFIAQKIWDATHPKQNANVQILDTGFDEEGLSGRLVLIRTLRLGVWFAGMFAAIWLIGYHVTVPVFVFFYLWVFGETKWWLAATAGAVYFFLIYVMFDLILHTEWPEPALLRWLS